MVDLISDSSQNEATDNRPLIRPSLVEKIAFKPVASVSPLSERVKAIRERERLDSPFNARTLKDDFDRVVRGRISKPGVNGDKTDPTSTGNAPVSQNFSLDIPIRASPEVRSPNGEKKGQATSTSYSSSVPHGAQIHRPVTPSALGQRPIQSNIEVVIESSPDILKKFQTRLPKSQAPPTKAEKAKLMKELEASTAPVYERPDEVRRVIGDTGFSAGYSVEEDLQRMRQAASKKKKTKVVRPQISLDVEETLSNSLQNLSLGRELIHPTQSAMDILTNRFDERVDPPITFVNEINDKRLHGKFQFIDRYVLGEKVKVAPTATNSGCPCVDCSLSTCLCFSKTIKDESRKQPVTKQIRTYKRRPDGLVVLSDEYIAKELDPTNLHFEITECNERCGCSSDCWNRVVGKGRTVPLEIFQTAKCGFGVRSSQDIVKGQFIETYLGEVVTHAELERREDASAEDTPSYVYSLDWFEQTRCHHVDSMHFGSSMRFVNHSCNPNARSFTVQIHKNDKKVYYLAFFAIKDIKAGVEIRIDYQGGTGSEEQPTQEDTAADAALTEGLVRCHCGEKKCRKILWTPNVKARRRRRYRE